MSWLCTPSLVLCRWESLTMRGGMISWYGNDLPYMYLNLSYVFMNLGLVNMSPLQSITQFIFCLFSTVFISQIYFTWTDVCLFFLVWYCNWCLIKESETLVYSRNLFELNSALFALHFWPTSLGKILCNNAQHPTDQKRHHRMFM